MNSGTGPGVFSDDGCAVEVYRRLTAAGEPEIIHAAIPPRATILELGAGAGRITYPLVQYGHRVTAVDSSAEMLAAIAGAETVLARIEDLDLGRRFDAVVLGSNLINTPLDDERLALLASCRRHVAADGVVLIERYIPENLRNAKDGFHDESDGIRCSLRDVEVVGERFSATLIYAGANGTWTHSFAAVILDEFSIRRELSEASLVFREWLDDRRSWFSATTTHNAHREE